MTPEEHKIANEVFGKWFDDPETKGVFEHNEFTEREIAALCFRHGFDLAKSMFSKQQDAKLPVPPDRPKSRVISENFVFPFVS